MLFLVGFMPNKVASNCADKIQGKHGVEVVSRHLSIIVSVSGKFQKYCDNTVADNFGHNNPIMKI